MSFFSLLLGICALVWVATRASSQYRCVKIFSRGVYGTRKEQGATEV